MGSEQYLDDGQELVDLPKIVMSSITGATPELIGLLAKRYDVARRNISRTKINLAQTFMTEDGYQEVALVYRNLDSRLELFSAEVTDLLRPVVKEIFQYAWESAHQSNTNGLKKTETIVSLDDAGYVLTVRSHGEQLSSAQKKRIERFENKGAKEKVTGMIDRDDLLSDMRLLVFYEMLRELDGAKVSVREIQEPVAVEIRMHIPYKPQLWAGESIDDFAVPKQPEVSCVSDFTPTYAVDPATQLEDAAKSAEDIKQIAIERLYLRDALVDGLGVLLGKYKESLRTILQAGRGLGKKIRPTIQQSYGPVVLDLFVGEDYRLQRTPALDGLVFDIAESLSELGGRQVNEIAVSANKDSAKGLYVVEIRSNGDYKKRIEVPLVELGIPQSQKI